MVYDSKRVGPFFQIKEQWKSIDKTFADYICKGMLLVKEEMDNLSGDELIGDEAINVMFLERAFLNAGLSYLFSQFEYYLFSIRAKMSNLCSIPLEGEVYGNIINMELNMILSIIGKKIEFEPSLSVKWDRILSYRKIRNVFVHENGVTNKGGTVYEIVFNLDDYIRKGYLKCYPMGLLKTEIQLSDFFVLGVCKDLTLFLYELIEFIEKDATFCLLTHKK